MVDKEQAPDSTEEASVDDKGKQERQEDPFADPARARAEQVGEQRQQAQK